METLNKVALNFILIIKLNLLKPLVDKVNLIKIYLNIIDLIFFVQINLKSYYNKKYLPINLVVKDDVLLQLYKGYNILFVLN